MEEPINIFVLDQDMIRSAQAHVDKHCVKMILETAQLLSTAHHILDGEKVPEGIYKATHVNHPCSKWVRTSNNNYNWLYCYLHCLFDEYTFRYGKKHKCMEMIPQLTNLPRNIEVGYLTPRPQCMPDKYKCADTVQAYRNYYIGEKANIAKWTKREPPQWWPKELL